MRRKSDLKKKMEKKMTMMMHLREDRDVKGRQKRMLVIIEGNEEQEQRIGQKVKILKMMIMRKMKGKRRVKFFV